MDESNENVAKKLIENLQGDLRSLTNEAKKKYPQIKDLSEAAMIKLRNVNLNQNSSAIFESLSSISNDILHPFLVAFRTKQVKLVQISLMAVQRMASHKIFDYPSAACVVNELWALMEAEIEELRLLQTVALLVTSNRLVQGPTLSKCLVLCFRLNFAKDPFVINTASATVRQLVAQVFERLQTETTKSEVSPTELRAPVKTPPKQLSAAGSDAFMLFQDLCRLVSAEPPFWLLGITEMTRTLGLDLLELILTQNIQLFSKTPEFVFLLKELVCPLVIKLFSPNLKYYQNQQRSQMGAVSSTNAAGESSTTVEKPYFPISMRLMRLVQCLIGRYCQILSTECEIFLSLLVKFVESDKIEWQRALAMEIIYRAVSQQNLLKLFCENYDMKPNSSKVLKDLASSVEGFLQSAFCGTDKSSTSESDQPEVVDQPGFVYRSNYIPFVNPLSQSSAKFSFSEMVEKVDPPQPPDGYTISLAFAATTEMVQNIQQLVDDFSVSNKSLCDQLILSTQNSLLSSLSLLFDASTDENLTETVLKCLNLVLKMSCRLKMTSVRDAYLATLCKSSLPPSYFSMIIPGGIEPKNLVGVDVHANTSLKTAPSNVVAVSTPCPVVGCSSASLNVPVMLTSKNLQAVRALLTAAQTNGAYLQESWHLVLITLQHIVWLLNLKPNSSGVLKPSQAAETGAGSNIVLTTAIMADIPVLTNLLSRVFESTSAMDIVALHHVINGLCALSSDAMQISVDGREPSYFAVSKLMETTLFNLHRADQFFKPVSSHFVELCGQPYQKLREWGAVALTTVVKSSLASEQESSEFRNPEFQKLLTTPLCNLNENSYDDIRQQQIECVLQMLRLRGQFIASIVWPSIIETIGTVPKQSLNDGLVRLSFQGVQFMTADLLPYIPSGCLLNLIELVASFGSQLRDLNISLSAVGVLWNVSDYLYRSSDKQVSTEDGSVADRVRLALYTYLSDLCVDSRPAVRKSACQTLFGTINSHGNTLQAVSWSPVLWKVLFPLLDKVKANSFSASTAKLDLSASGGTNILIHHSRDTESKQWAETVALTLAGVCRVFSSKRNILSGFSDYSRAWATLLQFVETLAVCNIEEISFAALKSFHELLSNKTPSDVASIVETSPEKSSSSAVVIISQPSSKPAAATLKTDGADATKSVVIRLDLSMWLTAWQVWLRIASASTDLTQLQKAKRTVPSPNYLTSMLNLFAPLFVNIKSSIDPRDLSQLLSILKSVIATPFSADVAVFILPAVSSDITPTQEAVINCLTLIYQESIVNNSNLRSILPELFSTLLTFVGFSCQPPSTDHNLQQIATTSAANNANFVAQNFTAFAEHCLRLVVEFYSNTAHLMEIIENAVVTEIIKVLALPLSLKYRCPSESTWKLSLQSLLTITRLSVSIAKDQKFSPYFHTFWPELAECLEKFLFNKNESPKNATSDERKRDEFMDCQVIEMIRTDILPYAKILPSAFVARIMELLYRGSIHGCDPKDVLNLDVGRQLRTELSRTCFEALLDASRGEPDLVVCSSPNGGSAVGAAALNSLLRRCRQVIIDYPSEERRSGGTPLPKHRAAEMTQVLTAIGTLIESLHRHVELNRTNVVWSQLIEMYPLLVDTIPCRQPEVQQALIKTLKSYTVMLGSPRPTQ